MALFNAEDKKIALMLLGSELNVEELVNETKLSREEVEASLTKMMGLKVIEKKFTGKYKLKENIAGELKKRREIIATDPYNLRLKAYIEIQAVQKSVLEEQLDIAIKNLRKNKDITIYSLEKAPPVKQEDYYSAYIELNFTARDFESLTRFVLAYGPSSIEVLRPSKLELPAQDFQDGLMQLAEIIQTYNANIARVLNKQELDEFNKKLSEKLKK